jgi:hypothetical protein
MKRWKCRFIAKVRIEGLRDYGAALSHLMLSDYSGLETYHSCAETQ